MKNNFEFILNEKFRSILDRDYKDADKALKSDLFKSAVILYGGVVEGMLKYLLLTKVYSSPELHKALKGLGDRKIRSHYERTKGLRFNEVIILSNKIGLTNEAGEVYLVKHFRNFVHIFKELESGIKIGKSKAITAKDFTNSIIGDLRKDWENRIERGKLFLTSAKAQGQAFREKPINKVILEKLYKSKYVDFVELKGKFPGKGKSLGSALGNTNKWGICQVDPMSWNVRHRCFQFRIFNPYFKKLIENYLKSKTKK